MDRAEAAAPLHRELATYAERSRAELERLIGDTDAYPVHGASGTEYPVEIDAVWDRDAGGAIRVLGAIDDGSFREALRPLSEDLLLDQARPEDGDE